MRFGISLIVFVFGVVLAKAAQRPLSEIYEEKTGEKARWVETLDIPYAEPTPDHPSANLVSLDVYSPENLDDGARLPALVLVHGGSWKSGDKASTSFLFHKVEYFVDAGYVVISINYGLTPEIAYPQQPQDVADAVAWIHQNAAQFQIDQDDISLMGHSAGAQLAALIATDGKFLRKAGSSPEAIRRVIMLDGISNLVSKVQQEILDENEDNNRDIIAAFGASQEALEAGSPVYQVKSRKKDYTPEMMLYFRGDQHRAQDDFGMITVLKKNGIKAGGVYVLDYSHAAMSFEVGKDDIITPSIKAFLEGADPTTLSAVHR